MVAIPQSSSMPEMDLSKKKILIIEDFQEMRGVFRGILRNCGADIKNILMAVNGDEAIALLRSEHFDIVLCDFNLGAGKNGQQVLEEAKFRAYIGLACVWIMVTAEKTSEAVTGAAEYQPDAYLLKPVTEASLRSRLHKIWSKKEAFVEIYQAMKEKDYSKAMSLCDERLAFDKANAAELLRTKCDLLFVNGELDRARQLLESTLAERDIPWAKVCLAKVLIKSNELITAKTLLEETLAVNPYFLEAHDLLVETLQAQGDVEGTGNALERAVKLSPNSVVRQKQLGDVAIKMGKLETAEKAFRKSVSLGENSVLKTAGSYIGLAKVCSENKNPTEALKVLGNLNISFADDDGVRLQAMAVEGMVHHQSGNVKKAQQIATELGQLVAQEGINPDSERSMEMARLLMATGKKEQAIALIQSEIKRNPENKALHDNATEIFTSVGMGEAGAELIETSRKEAMEIMNRGVLLMSKGKYEVAIDAMRDARQAMPSNQRALLNLAYVLITYMQKNRPTEDLISESRESLFAANALSPGEPRFTRLMGALNELAASK